MRTAILAILFVNALMSNGPNPQHAAEMSLYAPLIGDWDADVIDYTEDGKAMKNKGEWHFAWVLEGRAVQDVWIVPPRASRKLPLTAETRKGNRYGTSIRVYDPETRTWNITWINPVSGAFNRLVGRREGDTIVQEGSGGDGTIIRWTFSDITANSFHWRGELSTNGGKTWRLAAEFFGRRKVAR